MATDDKIRAEKVPYNINRKAAKISAYQHQVKLINMSYTIFIPSDQSRIIDQAQFIYSLVSKALEKQIKTIGDQEIKQVEALGAEENQELESIEGLFSKEK